MRREGDLLAIPTAGFVLYSLEEFCSQSLSAPWLFYPKLFDLTASTPGVPTDTGDNSSLLVPHENSQSLTIGNPGCLGVKFVESIFQVLDLFRGRIGLNDKFRHCLCLLS